LLGLQSTLIVRIHFRLFTEVMRKRRREVTQKNAEGALKLRDPLGQDDFDNIDAPNKKPPRSGSMAARESISAVVTDWRQLPATVLG
jgi:hypothetical protein